MILEPEIQEFVRQAETQTGMSFPIKYVYAFGDSPSMKDELLELVISGDKRATASLVEEYAQDGLDVPATGDLSIVLDGQGTPRVIVRTTEAKRVPFDEVSASFAYDEGEGNRSLNDWREGHQRYFGRESDKRKIVFTGESLVLCERFEVIYQAK